MSAADSTITISDPYRLGHRGPNLARGHGGGGPATKIVEAAGLSVRTLSVGEGEGTPVLLVHGFGSDLMSWLFNQEALAEGRAVHAFSVVLMLAALAWSAWLVLQQYRRRQTF